MNKKRQNILWEMAIVCIFIFIYILLRSINFSSHLNFSSEPASFSLKTLELFKTHKLELIGPPISFRIGARYLFQGSLVYYMMMPLLVFGSWDPVISSYLMVILGSIFIIALYIGTRCLVGKKTALLLTSLFVSFPFYIDYSRFFWNPNFQFLFTPFIILWMGLYKKYKNPLYIFLTSFTAGALLLLHYQYVIIIIGLTTYYFLFEKKFILRNKILLLIGFVVGFSPLMIFELRNQFYNTKTLFFFIQHYKQMFGTTHNLSFGAPHYLLSLSLFIILVLVGRFERRLSYKFLITVFTLLTAFSFYYYSVAPPHGFGMARDWNYVMEITTHEIIKSQHLKNYNIVNLGYDTVAVVQKYLLIKDGINGNFDDYYHNEYLFLITDGQNYMKNPAYEINTFKPNSIVGSWPLNTTYKVILLKRRLR